MKIGNVVKAVVYTFIAPLRLVLGNLFFGCVTAILTTGGYMYHHTPSQESSDAADINLINLVFTGAGLFVAFYGLRGLPLWAYIGIAPCMYVWEDIFRPWVSRVETWIYLNIPFIHENTFFTNFMVPVEAFLVALFLGAVIKGVLS